MELPARNTSSSSIPSGFPKIRKNERSTTGDMTSLGIIRLVMFSNDYQKKEMISYD
ncbi:hypothetical protein GTO83_10740 (plasmid) [Lactobacillus sp. 3B(2020)]|nr:hypothetical protein GTO83_10740 [Lactobacillus sp. 3B(2020)]